MLPGRALAWSVEKTHIEILWTGDELGVPSSRHGTIQPACVSVGSGETPLLNP